MEQQQIARYVSAEQCHGGGGGGGEKVMGFMCHSRRVCTIL